MTTLFAFVLPVAGCAAMMLLCSRMMRRGSCETPAAADASELADLRAEVARRRESLDSSATPALDEEVTR